MPDPDKVDEKVERSKNEEKQADVLTPGELKQVHEDANKVAADRATFLKNSLGKAFSPSTEHLKDIVVDIIDGAEKIVGLKDDSVPAKKALSDAGNLKTNPNEFTEAPQIEAGFDLARAAGNDLSLRHPIDSLKELAKRISGDDAPADKGGDNSNPKSPELGKDKPSEAAKPEEKPEDILAKYKDDPETKEEREKIEKLAEERIKDPKELKKFKDDMEAFEKRASEQKPPLKPEDIRGTYREISKLMEKPDGTDVPIKLNDRIKLAEQVMRQAAHPTDISQGEYSTCNTTTVEVRTYTKNPAEAARLVADVATTGKYTSNGTPPVTVEIDKDSLVRHGQSKNDIPGDNKRTYASQIFEVTATNVYYKGQRDQGKDDIRYEQHEPRPAGPNNKPPYDNGERLYNYSKLDPKTGKPTEVSDPHNEKILARSPNLGNSAIAEINRQINKEAKDGSCEGPIVISREEENGQRRLALKTELLAWELKMKGIGEGKSPDLKDPAEVQRLKEEIDKREKECAEKRASGIEPSRTDLDHETAEKLKSQLDVLSKETRQEYRNDDGVVYIHSPQEMEQTLAKMKAEGRLPAIIAVSASAEPFKSDSGGHQTGDLGGGHVVTVTDYHPAENGKPARVDVDNQWAKSADRSMTVEELYNAQETPKGPVMEKLEALEKKYAAKEINDADYDKELQKLYLEQIKRWDEAQKSGNPDKEKLAVETLKDSLRSLQPPSRGQKILRDAIAEYKKEKSANP